MDRPALQSLLIDIEKGKVDLIVVYKVDRLTRSLMDFARIIETFDASGISFVSVTQQFNTANSMGRLTLNVLLSFAQFEREVTAERIRDKIAASKKKGMWMGGLPPLGYDAIDKKLVVNAKEATVIRSLFDLYLDLKSVRKLKEEADRKRYVTKLRTTAGTVTGGHTFTRGHLYQLLHNPLYVGEVRHKEKTYTGQHEPIVKPQTWAAV
jgi:site-specific DNA recombinase